MLRHSTTCRKGKGYIKKLKQKPTNFVLKNNSSQPKSLEENTIAKRLTLKLLIKTTSSNLNLLNLQRTLTRRCQFNL